MGMISVPVDAQQERAIESLIRSGYGETKAGVLRKALRKATEDNLMERLMQSELDIKAGRMYKGRLTDLIKKIK